MSLSFVKDRDFISAGDESASPIVGSAPPGRLRLRGGRVFFVVFFVLISCKLTGAGGSAEAHNVTQFRKDKPILFVLGASKTGTSELSSILRSQVGNCCHNCDSWWMNTDPAQIKFNCYADNGDYADFKTLDKLVHNARFILNTRMLRPWISSMHRHIAGIRTAHNCSVSGTHADCLYNGWVSNSKENLEWRAKVFLKSADQAEKYFRKKDNLVIIRLEDYATTWPIGLAIAVRNVRPPGQHDARAKVVPLKLPAVGYSWSAVHSINMTNDSIAFGDWMHQKYCVEQGNKLSEFQCWAFCSLHEHTCNWSRTAWYVNITTTAAKKKKKQN